MTGSKSGLFAGMICGVLLAGAIAVANTGPAAPTISSPLSAIDLDTLGIYLAPAAPAPVLDEYGAFLPAIAAVPVHGIDIVEPTAQAVARRDWIVTAIMTGGRQPLAIIDNAPFAPGATLPDGARVVAIETDHVILRESDGTLRTLRLKAG